MNTENIVNYDVNKVEKLQQDFNELKEMLYTHVLQTSANNKVVEKYKSLFSENQPSSKGPKKKVQGSTLILDANSAERT